MTTVNHEENIYATDDHGSVCHIHNPVLSVFMAYRQVCNKSNMTGPTGGAGTVNPSGHTSLPLVCYGGSCSLIFSFL